MFLLFYYIPKDKKEYVLPYITYLRNTIIKSSRFPAMWKSDKIIPVPKQDKTYRPIAILPYLLKIFEKLVYKQITQYLYGNGVLSERQSGFRSNHSCIPALINVSAELRLEADNNMT